jgi:hypothetical protein
MAAETPRTGLALAEVVFGAVNPSGMWLCFREF